MPSLAPSDDDREFGNLIGSDKVEGTAVYGADSKKIGSIKRVMLDKRTGKASYAVLSSAASSGSATTTIPCRGTP
jgi:hypothetical protein